jgi:cytochrome P450
VLSATSILGRILPRIPGISLGPNHSFRSKHTSFVKAGSDVYSIVSAWPEPRTDLFIADPALIKEIVSVRSRFPKPIQDYVLLLFFGRNIVASEGEEWKKYRKVSAPAFSDVSDFIVSLRVMQTLPSSKKA